METYFRSQRGLTLVELLAVIVILGIMATIAVLSLRTVIENVSNEAIVAEAVNIIQATKLERSHQRDNAVPNGGWVHQNPNVNQRAIEDYIDNVNFTSYIVTFDSTNGVYEILGHPAEGIVNDSKDSNGKPTIQSIEESVLLQFME
ncbi:type II secretion system protein [Bacillus solimangrovi]|uniref:Prepilin-type N-terminal cleavage/methylation domain-containing protein n=1 Tax=Bacillus solimangrovi TaxID=1305675 RepID=A0A1E5LBK7_9BACI|nr:type II secretion system protein [Bacillus solimangrovi]OEH91454.1 hypothetical protein BFG57_04890 [Bacillus solimangrovi]